MKQDILGLRPKAYGRCKAFSGDISSCPVGGRQQCRNSFRGFGAEVSRASTLQGLSHVRQNLLEACLDFNSRTIPTAPAMSEVKSHHHVTEGASNTFPVRHFLIEPHIVSRPNLLLLLSKL